MKKYLLTSIFISQLFVFGSAFGDTAASPSPSPANADDKAAISASPTPANEGSKAGQSAEDAKKNAKKKGPKAMFAVLDTTLGKIKVKLFIDKAPKTVDNFVDLAEAKKEWKDPSSGDKKKSHFYDGLLFHRVIPNFMIQGGDPVGNGTGGPGYQFPDEKYEGMVFDKPGYLAMANAGPDTNGSQFFITTVATTWLNGKHTIFGEVTEGMDIVTKISNAPRDMTNDKPLKDIKINKVTIIRK